MLFPLCHPGRLLVVILNEGSERPEKEPVALSQWRTGGSPVRGVRISPPAGDPAAASCFFPFFNLELIPEVYT